MSRRLSEQRAIPPKFPPTAPDPGKGRSGARKMVASGHRPVWPPSKMRNPSGPTIRGHLRLPPHHSNNPLNPPGS